MSRKEKTKMENDNEFKKKLAELTFVANVPLLVAEAECIKKAREKEGKGMIAETRRLLAISEKAKADLAILVKEHESYFTSGEFERDVAAKCPAFNVIPFRQEELTYKWYGIRFSELDVPERTPKMAKATKAALAARAAGDPEETAETDGK
jgi:hypothetical protein